MTNLTEYINMGKENTGAYNSGGWNSGNLNSGDWNSTSRESGMFNSTEGTIRMFNKPTNLIWDEIDKPHSSGFYTTEWISEVEMTDDEKVANPKFLVSKGYLKTYTYKEAWANFWRDTSENNRQKFLNLPNFDAEVFEEITGIDLNPIKKETIEIGDKTYEVTQDLMDALNNLEEVS